MRHLAICLGLLASVAGRTDIASGQSAFALCSDTLPNRIISIGAVRAVVATVDSLRACLAVEGFSDSAAIHPRDWASSSRLVLLETRVRGDTRRMQETQILKSWTGNDQPLAMDSTAARWRANVIDLVSAKWDVAARRMERQELTQTIAALVGQKTWILAQIDTLRRREDSLRLAVAGHASRARMDKQERVNAATKNESAARSRLARAQSSLAAAAKSDEPGRAQRAQEAVRVAEDAVRTASEQVRIAQSTDPLASPAVTETQDLLFRLEATARIKTLNAMLADVDADHRVAAMTAALQAIDAQPDPEERLRAAAAKLRAILAR